MTLATDTHTADVSVATVDFADCAGILSDSDKQMLREKTAETDFPDSVGKVVYLTFAENDDNLNDTVRHFGEDERPDLLDADQKKYAPGVVIVAVGLDPRAMGVYAGDDVAADTDLQDDARIEGITDEMREPLQEENWALGLVNGAKGVAAPELRAEESVWPIILGLGTAVGGAGIGLGGIYLHNRKKNAKQAREDYRYILAHHGDLANRLDAIDIRAHSLTSVFANDEFRRQWDNIKSSFLSAHSTLNTVGELDSSSPDSQFRAHHKELAKARKSVEEAVNAEENVEELAALEHGDGDTRRRALTDLHEDVLAAQSKAAKNAKRELADIDKRVLALRDAPESPSFMDDYAGILSDYRAVVERVQKSMYDGDDEEAELGTHSAPTLGSESWRPGVGSHYVPFFVVSDWHTSDVQAASGGNGSVTTGYSDGGFSGAGGSSSF